MLTKILLGTYTKNKSQGIYSITLDTQQEDLRDLTLIAKEVGPTYLAQSKAGQLFNVTSVEGKGGIANYDANYHLVNTVTQEGASPCYVAIDEKRQLVYSANYHKGQVAVYQILADGQIALVDEVFHNDPVGPHENQDKPHAHYADLTPDDRLVACDLGTDIVYTYDVSAQGKLTKVASLKLPAGTGPRHLAFHPQLDIAYLFGELNSTITILTYHRKTGEFSIGASYSTLPNDFVGFNSGSAVHITSDGRFLYGSNRGHNSIVCFEISEDGQQLTFNQRIQSEGDFPRDFAIDPSEEYLVCAHQNSDNLTLFYRDKQTGILSLLKKDIFAPECVCVKFI